MNIAVIGAGGAGAVFSMILSKNGHTVTILAPDAEQAKNLSETHVSPWLKDLTLPQDIEYTADPTIVTGKDMVVFACPSFAMRQECQTVAPYLSEESILVSVVKGIEADTNLTMTEIIAEVTGYNAAVLSGPIHTVELAKGLPSGCVVASSNVREAKIVQDAFMNEALRVYTSKDVRGVEIAGSLKNVIALCCGCSDGLGYEDNTKALLMTRGMMELTNFGVHFGAEAETFSGLGGFGDLVNTCTSPHSRNRKVGELIGQGKTVEEAMEAIGSVAEGYYAAKAVKQLADREGLYLPIMSAAYDVLYNNVSPKEAVGKLMTLRKMDELGRGSGWFLD